MNKSHTIKIILSFALCPTPCLSLGHDFGHINTGGAKRRQWFRATHFYYDNTVALYEAHNK